MRNYSNNASLDPALPEQDRCREQEVDGAVGAKREEERGKREEEPQMTQISADSILGN